MDGRLRRGICRAIAFWSLPAGFGVACVIWCVGFGGLGRNERRVTVVRGAASMAGHGPVLAWSPRERSMTEWLAFAANGRVILSLSGSGVLDRWTIRTADRGDRSHE